MSKHFQHPFNPLNWPAVPHDYTGDNNLGIYTNETTQRYVHGTRYITWDGRVYKYGKTTTSGVTSYQGCCGTIEAPHSYTVSAISHSAGSRLISITKTGVTEDLYAGGMIAVYKSTGANTTHHFIVGNEASGATYTDLYIEFPLNSAITAATEYYEVYDNQYRLMQGAAVNNQTDAWLGVSCVTAASGYNVWIQTWGPTLISPGNTTLDDAAADERTCYWVGNGTLKEVGDALVTAGENQIAGYIFNSGTAGIAGPQIYLMCST